MLKRIILLLIILLLFPTTILLTHSQSSTLKDIKTAFKEKLGFNSPNPNTVPKLKNQPKDTEIVQTPISIHHWITSNGCPVYFVPTENLPIIDILVSFDAGSARDSDKLGLSRLTAKLLDQGTDKLNADQIAMLFESKGAIYKSHIDQDRILLSIRSLTDPNFLPSIVNVFSEILGSPSWPEHRIQQLKNQAITILNKESQKPEEIIKKAFLQAIYEHHPYGHLPLGTIKTISEIKKEDLAQFHTQYFVAQNASITIVGGVHRDTARDISEQVVRGVKSGSRAPALPPVENLKKPSQIKIDFASNQSHVRLGQPLYSLGDKDYFALKVGNYILGEGLLVSRLFLEIRDKRGLAYTAHSVLQGLREQGPFFMKLQTENKQTEAAIQLLQKTLIDFINDGPTEAELLSAKKGMIGAFPLKLDSNEKIAKMVSEITFYGLPIDFLSTYRQQIEQVTQTQIQTAFKERVHPDKMALIIVGKTP